MNPHLCRDPEHWKRELRRLHARGSWDTPELEAIISDPHAEKVAYVEQILRELGA